MLAVSSDILYVLHTNFATTIAEERLADAEFSTDAVAYAAAARPAKTAVVALADDARLSYAALSELANRAAGWLAARLGGAPEGQRLAYLGRNGVELLVLALGAERCGAIFVPVNWRLAGAEIAALLEDCTPAVVVAQDEFLPLLREGVAVTEVLAPICATPALPRRDLPHDRPIIVLYTSGTTGRPKGVIVTARNAFAAALNFIAVGEVHPGSVTLSDLPMFHTIGLIAVARSTLMAGGTLVLTDRFVASRTLAALGDAALGVTHYFAVPTMAEALAADPAFDPAALTRLHAIFVGGAPLAPALIERFLGFGVPLVNGYGMSEAGTAIHVPIDREAVRMSAGAVGLPAPHVSVRLVANGANVADGEVGEVWLRGPSVTPGYWNRPDETAAVFVDGWYRTGDLARREVSGMYRIVDRLKDMYVSGGENVYPAEVEAVVVASEMVADVAVLGVPDARWGEAGVAFVVPRAAAGFNAEALGSHCAAHLAKYKCPSRVVVVEAIPRSAAGKVLKPVLRQRLMNGEFG
jgi:fatty-acyl-CoA synthase